jgi:lipopolysaccharide/colanic/teichoic acid biosynthesis glycosyltransferase
MTRFRFLVIALIVWLTFIYNLERPDFEFLGLGATNIDLNNSVYIVAALISIGAVFFPDLIKSTLRMLVFSFSTYFIGMLLDRPISEQRIYIVVTELAIVFVTILIARQISIVLSRFEETVEDVLLRPNDLRVLNKEVGEELMTSEIERGRYFGHPVGFIVMKLGSIMKELQDENTVYFDLELTMQRRYIQLRAAQMARLLLPKITLITWDNEDMIVCMPQSDEEMTFTAAYALNRELIVQLSLDVSMGMSIFAKDGLIYEDLVTYARNNVLVFADLFPEELKDAISEPKDKDKEPEVKKEEQKTGWRSRIPFPFQWVGSKVIEAKNQTKSIANPLPEFHLEFKRKESSSQSKKLYNPDFWLHNIPYQSLGARSVYQIFKRGFDLLAVMGGMIFAAPVMFTIAMLIKLEDGGPIFYTQTRTGWGGRTFKMYKFRSMVTNSKDVLRQLAAQGLADIDENGNLTAPLKLDPDPRITKIGRIIRKTSLDELPQLLNVIKGDMSLVGPRPTSWQVSNYTLEQTGRLAARPGMTGLWQITERGNTDFDVWLLWDRAYIERMCLSLDLQILIRTVGKVFTRSGR